MAVPSLSMELSLSFDAHSLASFIFNIRCFVERLRGCGAVLHVFFDGMREGRLRLDGEILLF
jgi:hypothetical protein